MYDFDKFEEVATQKFYEENPAWNDIPADELSICDNGEIWVGNTQFIVDVKLEDFKKQ